MIPQRLISIAKSIPAGLRVADIGTDHCFLPVLLVKKGFPTPIGVEVKKGPYKQSLRILSKNNIRVEMRLGYGLRPLKEQEVDCVVIAGMGGKTMRSILGDCEKKSRSFPYYVLQPAVHAEELRTALFENDFGILDEWVVKEGRRYYETIFAAPRQIGIPPLVCEAYPSLDTVFLVSIGPRLLLDTSDLTAEFFRYRLMSASKMMEQTRKSKDESTFRSAASLFSQWKLVVSCHTRYRNAVKSWNA